jgi:TldD protein
VLGRVGGVAATGSSRPAAFELDAVAGELAPGVLDQARRRGCAHAELRVERIRTQVVVVRDRAVETAVDDVEVGAGVRVVHGGAFGFAATDRLEAPAEGLVDAAVALAEQCGPLVRRSVELAEEPVHGPARWVGPHQVDPTSVELAEKVGLLRRWCDELLASAAVRHATASVTCVVEEKHYADLAGRVTHQLRVRVHPVVEAVGFDAAGDVETMRTLAPPTARGWEYLTGVGADLDGEVAELPGLLEEKLRAPSVEAGPTDLVIHPSNLWLTIHESIGHALELDRALGYEAAYAGTSFATVDQLGSLVYGAPIMQVTGDRTTEHGLATIGFDDEGVQAQRFDLVRDGILVGYQLDRRMAAEQRLGRSNGCAYADSPMHVPIQRMANVSLQADPAGPSVEELVGDTASGILVVGDKSWSIDMQRHNFQFTGQRFHRIERGRLVGQLRDVAYQSRTTEFWRALDAVGGPGTVVLGGAMNCGKGQPGQVAPVSHGCPVARFRQVSVLNTRREAGR